MKENRRCNIVDENLKLLPPRLLENVTLEEGPSVQNKRTHK